MAILERRPFAGITIACTHARPASGLLGQRAAGQWIPGGTGTTLSRSAGQRLAAQPRRGAARSRPRLSRRARHRCPARSPPPCSLPPAVRPPRALARDKCPVVLTSPRTKRLLRVAASSGGTRSHRSGPLPASRGRGGAPNPLYAIPVGLSTRCRVRGPRYGVAKMRCVTLFSGCGGLDLGLQQVRRAPRSAP